jgi:hypothetical protein
VEIKAEGKRKIMQPVVLAGDNVSDILSMDSGDFRSKSREPVRKPNKDLTHMMQSNREYSAGPSRPVSDIKLKNL